MDYFVWQRTVVDEAGNVLASASVTVTDVVSGALAQLYSDEGVTGIGNPMTADSNGFAQFYVKSGIYNIVATSGADTRTWSDEAIGAPYKITAAETSAGVTPTNYQYPTGNVPRYGTNTTPGTTDMTAAFQAAIDVAAEMGDGGYVAIPAGEYLVTSTLLVSDNRIHIRGAGTLATKLVFTPTANDVMLEFHNGSSAISACSLRDLSIYSADSTYTKTAVALYDVEEFDLENIVIRGTVVVGSATFWSGNSDTSIGLRVYGRQTLRVRNLDISADRPLVLSVNPNNAIDADHFHFDNTYLFANGNPVVEIESNFDLTNVKFGGQHAWVGGTHGLYWNDSAAAANSTHLLLENVRTEQGESATAYNVYIDHNNLLRGLVLRDCRFDLAREGIYLRNVADAKLDTVFYDGGSGRIALNVDSTVARISGVNCYFQIDATATLTGQRLLGYGPRDQTAMPLPHDFKYVSTSQTDYTTVFGSPIQGASVTLADDASVIVGPTSGVLGFLFIQAVTEDMNAIYILNGATGTVTEVSDASGTFVGTDTDTNYCVFVSGSDYVIRNRRGGSRVVRYMVIGSHEG